MIGLISGTVTASARVAGHAISLGITGAMMVGINIYLCYGIKRRKKWYGGMGCCKVYGPSICTAVAACLILLDPTRHVLQDNNVWAECPRGELIETGMITAEAMPWPAAECAFYSNQFACVFPDKGDPPLDCDGKWCENGMPCASPSHPERKNGTHICPPPCKEEDQLKAKCGCVLTSQENMGHLSFIGVVFTVLFTYIGFVFLMLGTFWNANIMDKCGKIKAQWKKLRGNKNRSYEALDR